MYREIFSHHYPSPTAASTVPHVSTGTINQSFGKVSTFSVNFRYCRGRNICPKCVFPPVRSSAKIYSLHASFSAITFACFENILIFKLNFYLSFLFFPFTVGAKSIFSRRRKVCNFNQQYLGLWMS
jgi:hypothetical protein